MELVDNGLIKPDALLAYFKQDTNIIESDHIRGYDLALIANHKGRWTVAFNGVPRVEYLGTVIKFFENEQSSDGLQKLIYNYGKSDEVVFENVAGTLKTGKQILEEPVTYILKHLGFNIGSHPQHQ